MIYRNLLLGILTACAIMLSFEAALLLRETRFKVDQIAGDVHAIVLPTENAEAQIAAASKTFAQVGAKERDAFATQQKYYADLTQKTDMLIGDADESIRLVNAGILPSVRAAVDSAHQLVLDSTRSIHSLSTHGEATLDAAQPVLVNLSTDLADLQPVIESTDRIAASSEQTSANIEGTTADLKKIADQWVAPVKGFWNHVKLFVFEVAGPAASAATAIFKR